MKKVLVVAALMGALVPSFALAQTAPAKAVAQTTEQAVTALENAWLKAFVANDVAWHEKNIAANAVFTNVKGEVRDKAAAIARMKNEPFKGTATGTVTKVNVFGDTAIAYGVETDKGTQGGKDASGTYAWTDTWVKINGQWQCVASHSSTIEAKK